MSNTPARWSGGEMSAYQMGLQLGSQGGTTRTHTRQRREVIQTEDSTHLIEEIEIIEERYW